MEEENEISAEDLLDFETEDRSHDNTLEILNKTK